jgi:hypothetical protein
VAALRVRTCLAFRGHLIFQPTLFCPTQIDANLPQDRPQIAGPIDRFLP